MSMRAIFREVNPVRAPTLIALHPETETRDPILLTDAVPSGKTAHNLSPRRALLRPFAVGLLCLAVSVVLWGLGYKLSLYRPHPNPTTRTRVAKLWVSPRDDRSIVSVQAASAGHSTIDLHGLFALNLPSHQFGDAALNYFGASTGSLTIRLLLGTLRSPPHVISK
jgi:hypothetical protein